MKKIAVIFLALALAMIAASFGFSQRAIAIQGPSALAVMADETVWLSVDESLWHLAREGQLLGKVEGSALGLKGRVGNMARHPSGQLVLGIKDQNELYFFNPLKAQIDSRLLPRWPESLVRHASRAINYAFSPSGLLAIATGGGHAVALFDEAGQFLQRSPANLYRFTNGLWWEGERLWTTNTNAFELIQLSPATMEPIETVVLTDSGQGMFLGVAVASQGQSHSSTPASTPFATVVRLTNGMVHGRIVDVFANGEEREFQGSVGLEHRDIAWLGDRLLAIDGQSYAVKQFGSDGLPLVNFGDAAVQNELASLLQSRQRFNLAHDVFLYFAVGLFLVGFVLAVAAERVLVKAKLDPGIPSVTPESMGLLVISKPAFVRKSLLFLPLWLLIGLAVWSVLASLESPGWLIRQLLSLGLWGGLCTLGGVLLLALVYNHAAMGWAGHRLAWEPVVNAYALRLLRSPELACLLKPDEVVRETLMLTRFSNHWIVLTQSRVLVFEVNARDQVLRQVIDRGDITSATLTPWRSFNWLTMLDTLWSAGTARLDVDTTNGPPLSGYVNSIATAERMISLLALPYRRSLAGTSTRPVSVANPGFGALRWQLMASGLIPGLGQWMQRRRVTALHYFLPFTGVLILLTVPLVWTLYGPRAAVSSSIVYQAIGFHLFMAAQATWDCWRLRRI